MYQMKHKCLIIAIKMLTLNGKILKFGVSIFLYVLGGFKSDLISIVYCTIFMSLTILSLIGSTVGFVNTNSTKTRVESFGVFYTSFMLNCLDLTLLLHRKKIQNLLHFLEGNIHCKTNIINRTSQLANKKLFIFTCFHAIAGTSFYLPPLINSMTTPITESIETQKIIQYWFTCGQSEHRGLKKTPCIEFESKGELFFKNMLMGAMAALQHFGFFSGTMLYCVVMAEFWIHLDTFRSKIIDLSNFSNRFLCHLDTNWRTDRRKRNLLIQYRIKARKDFMEIVEYQQFIRDCTKEIESTFGRFINIFIVQSFGVLVVLIILVFQEDNKILLFKHIPISSIILLTVILVCYFGQIISDLNDILLNEINQIPWYQHDLSFRKIYAMTLDQNYIPLETKLFDARVINLTLLLAIFRALYSMINVLLLQIGT